MNGRRKVHVKKRMKVEGEEEENMERNFLEKWDHGPCTVCPGSMCFLLSGGMVAMVSGAVVSGVVVSGAVVSGAVVCGAVVSGASCSSTLVCDPSAADWSVPGWLWPRWARRIARLWRK